MLVQKSLETYGMHKIIILMWQGFFLFFLKELLLCNVIYIEPFTRKI